MKDQDGDVLDLLSRLEVSFDRAKQRLAERIDRDEPLQILPYRGFGTPERLLLQGRILQGEPVGASSKGDTVWKNLGNVWKRFESDEVPGVTVRATLGDWSADTKTDEEGYFRFDIRLPQPLADRDRLWHEVRLDMRDPRTETPVSAVGSVLRWRPAPPRWL